MTATMVRGPAIPQCVGKDDILGLSPQPLKTTLASVACLIHSVSETTSLSNSVLVLCVQVSLSWGDVNRNICSQ